MHMTTYTQQVLMNVAEIERGNARYRAEVAYLNAVMSAATQTADDIRADDGVDVDLDDAITGVYAFAFDMAGALAKVAELRRLLDCHLDADHLAELGALAHSVEAAGGTL